MTGWLRRMVLVFAVGLAAMIALQVLFGLGQRRTDGSAIPFAVGPPTRAVTVEDVLAANLPSPVRSRVSFPGFSYHDAFPEATDEPEIVIEGFESPTILADLPASMPDAWRMHFPANLPPAEERLPRNPAVVRGPDGLGRYGGVWRRTSTAVNDIATKIGYESFVRHDPSGRIRPSLAYHWTIEDNRTFTFYLRRGHRWSDGHPFTSHDIAWVCNTMIGSEAWFSPPGWMQHTDGAAMLYDRDLLDATGLARRLQAEAAEQGPAALFLDAGGERLREAVAEAAETEDEPDGMLRFRLVEGLNRAFRRTGRERFNPEMWAHLSLDAEVEALRGDGFSRLDRAGRDRLQLLLERNDIFTRAVRDPDTLEQAHWNRLFLLLFRLHYDGLVDHAREERVIVETVPDEDGDTSHIVRFRFPRPASIFLENTATFMFYRGLFSTPAHFNAPYHPDGTDQITSTDMLNWPALLTALHRDGTAGADTPAGRFHAILDAETQARLAAAAEAGVIPAAATQEALLPGFNRALEASASFFDDAAWAPIDLDAELAGILEQGVSVARRDLGAWRRFSELLLREDMLVRVRRDGIGSLDDGERAAFNRAMFRAAFDRHQVDRNWVATNRAHGLNEAAYRHPRRYTSWLARFRGASQYDPDNPIHVPTLTAWRRVSDPTARTQLAVRNAFYYRVDETGRQLPYIDAVETTAEGETSLVLLRMRTGHVDFQVREITFEHFTFLKQNEEAGNYRVRLWANDYVGEVTFFPVQSHSDPQLERLFGDPRFTHALSHAINRQEVIDVFFGGMGEPAQYSMPRGSPYYSERHATTAIDYDPARANQLLDAMGLDRHAADGTRLLWDGTPMIVNVDAPQGSPTALVELVVHYWNAIGVNARMKVRSPQVISRMINMGIADIVVHKEGGNFFGPLMAGGYAPTHPAESRQWNRWANFLRSGGRAGIEPPERILDLERMWNEVTEAPNEEEKMAAWNRLVDRNAEDLPIIGLMNSPGKVVYVSNRFRNVPELALAGWIAHEPGNVNPELFFFADD